MTTTRISNASIVQTVTNKTAKKSFVENRWGLRHVQAWSAPMPGGETAIKSLIMGWVGYADEFHRAAFADGYDTIADDSYAREYWLLVARGIRGLLSMDIGRLDGGTLDHLVLSVLNNEGLSDSDL